MKFEIEIPDLDNLVLEALVEDAKTLRNNIRNSARDMSYADNSRMFHLRNINESMNHFEAVNVVIRYYGGTEVNLYET